MSKYCSPTYPSEHIQTETCLPHILNSKTIFPSLIKAKHSPVPQSSYKISMQDPVGMEVMDAIQNLIEQRLHHSSRQLKRLLVGLRCSVELNNVLWKEKVNGEQGCARTD